jgi:hypothetical protein
MLDRYTTEKGISTNEECLSISCSSPDSGPLDFLLDIEISKLQRLFSG